MRIPLTLATLLLCGLSAPALAGKLYKWVDEKGNVHYSDKVPPDAAKLARKEMNDRGVVVKQVARAKTDEELAAEAAQAAREAEEQKVAEAKAQADRALMLSYNSEADLDRALEQELAGIDGSVATAKLTLASQEKNLADLLAHAADFERGKQAVPQNVQDSIASVRKQIEGQQAMLLQREKEKETVRLAYEDKRKRWRELTEAADKQANGG